MPFKFNKRDVLLVTAGAVGASIATYVYLYYNNNKVTNKRIANNNNKNKNKNNKKKNIIKPSESSSASTKIKTGKTSGTYLIRAPVLREFVAKVLVKCGCYKEDAKKAAKVLILADLRGIDSHGIARLMAYFSMLKNNIINPKPRIRIIKETASTATVDGDNGLGLIVGPKCNEIAMEKAEKVGSGWVSVRNTHHYGIAGSYSLECLKKDMIGISMTNSGSVVAPLYGKKRYLGTNPIAIAFPCTNKGRPMIIDMATSVVPWGKVEECSRTGQNLGGNWAIDSDGLECTDPDKVLGEGALMNLGGHRINSGHKGYCLAAMVDILCAVLSGGNWGPTVDGFTTNAVNYGDSTKSNNDGDDNKKEESTTIHQRVNGIGHFFGAMRINGFRPVNEFQQTMDLWIKTFRNCPPIDETQPVLIPGDPEYKASLERTKNGIPVKLSVCCDLQDIASELNIPPPFDVNNMPDLKNVKRVIIDAT